MDAEEPSPTERIQLNQNCDQKTMSSQMSLAISYLLSQNQQDRQKGKDILLRYQNSSYSELLKKIIIAVKFASTHQNKHYCLLFLLSKLDSYTGQNDIPNLTLQLEAIITQVPEELRSLAVQCMNIYLNRLQIEILREEYFGNLVKKVEQQIDQNALSQSLIQTFTDILSHREKPALCFFYKNAKTFKNILEKCQNDQVLSKKWFKFMLTLINMENFRSSSEWSYQFVYKNLVNKEATYLGVQQILRLTKIFNLYWDCFKDITQINQILTVQLCRVNDKQFMLKLNQQIVNEDSFGAIIQSIEKAIVLIFISGKKQKNPSAVEIQIINRVLHPSFFVQVLNYLFSLPGLTNTDKISIYNLCNFIILYMSYHVSRELLCSTIDTLCQYLEVKGRDKQLTYVYELMGNVDLKIFKYFPYLKVIQYGFNQIVNKNWPINSQYLKMVNFCLKNLHESAQSFQIMTVVGKLVKYCLQLEFNTRLEMRSLVFVVMCEYLQKIDRQYELPNRAQNQFKQMLKIGFPLLKQLLSVQEIDEITFEDVFERMWHVCLHFVKYKLTACKQNYTKSYEEFAINYLYQFINTEIKNPKIINLHLKFLRLISQNQNISFLDNEISALIFSNLFKCNSDLIRQQCCSLILLVLIKINKQWDENYFTCLYNLPIIMNILGTDLLGYIQSNLKKKNDEPLFSKILIELMAYKDSRYPVKQMLMRVVDEIYAYQDIQEDVQYNFDRVFEAIVIIDGQEEQNYYLQMKGINKRVANFRSERQSMTGTLERESQLPQAKVMRQEKQKWSSQPDVSRVIQKGSNMGQYLDYKVMNPTY